MGAERMNAVKNLYPNVGSITEKEDGSMIILDGSGNTVGIDTTNVDAEEARLDALRPMKFLRGRRNVKLSQCDWTQGADVPVGIKTTWQAYRQQLRDLPNNQTPSDETLSNITWPTEPS